MNKDNYSKQTPDDKAIEADATRVSESEIEKHFFAIARRNRLLTWLTVSIFTVIVVVGGATILLAIGKLEKEFEIIRGELSLLSRMSQKTDEDLDAFTERFEARFEGEDSEIAKLLVEFLKRDRQRIKYLDKKVVELNRNDSTMVALINSYVKKPRESDDILAAQMKELETAFQDLRKSNSTAVAQIQNFETAFQDLRKSNSTAVAQIQNFETAFQNLRKSNTTTVVQMKELGTSVGDLRKSNTTIVAQIESLGASVRKQLGLAEEDLLIKGKEYFEAEKYNSALSLFQQAASGGNAEGMSYLGYMYMNGISVEHNFEEALYWYRKAAEVGNARGMNNLGVMYYNGTGVEQDFEEAVHWYRKAAGAGDVSGMYNLGVSYEEGTGVEKNLDEAVRWYRKAAALGSESAKDKLKELGEQP